MKIGDAVTYVDPKGIEHAALVTANWGGDAPDPSLNLVYVSDDETQTDNYGRQIGRNTSVVAEARQHAHGNYWKA
jgi:hypothetical protein